eukprot:GILI01020423.1.p1 GENE.GILI01020423.1~~GILI01020423.1.p1  ORF type:complete len:362 (+),score=84.27 GILI01020423.1:86-1171(+)
MTDSAIDNAQPKFAMNAEGQRVFRIVTRSSQLAMVQTHEVLAMLSQRYPELAAAERFVVQKTTTVGDQRLDVPLAAIGGQGVFTKELERELYRSSADIAVHSLKDLPTQIPPGLVVAAIPSRHSRDDALVLSVRHKDSGFTMETLPAGSVVGTSSVRRIACYQRAFPHIVFKDIRGNLNTRLRKLDDGEYDGIVLATAGLRRLGWGDRISQVLPEDQYLYAPGQGALAIQCREDDEEVVNILSVLNDASARAGVQAEREFMRVLEGGCRVPIAACTTVAEGLLRVQGQVWSQDGARTIRAEVTGPLDSAASLGSSLAATLIEQGAGVILKEIKEQSHTQQKLDVDALIAAASNTSTPSTSS